MRKHLSLKGATVATLLALAMSPAQAADTDLPARGPLPFSSFDADGDGRISQEEFNRTHTERVQQRTQTTNQYRYMGNAPPIGAIDRNADGAVSPEEFQAHQQRQQQYQQRQQQMYQERMNMGRPGGMGMGGGPGGGRR
jgi:hypothetical protein